MPALTVILTHSSNSKSVEEIETHGEWDAEVYSCEADRTQASLIYTVVVDMIGFCLALMKRLKIVAFQKRIVYPAMNSFYQVLSIEAFSKHGINLHAVLYDELHVVNDVKIFKRIYI